ncbi:DUF6907 domain-containing protein [Segeticoccus rhizosphaerae]|uniref:DUF6907 domain-containing protein n=1 Tax=Segeticoccus rhizosphaerae TaxID=1104777 RepID=UPI0010C0C1B7|nr:MULTISPECIES: hypothetical protein [Intrasporangiaceae]
MSDSVRRRAMGGHPGAARETCPRWCVTAHGMHLGEDDWVHMGEPVALADGVLARLCLSVDPRSGAKDGPYVVVGSSEYTLDEAAALGVALVAMANAGHQAIRP